MIKPIDLISPAYRQEQVLLHARPGGYGGKGDKWAPVVAQIARSVDAMSVLDYGCGQGRLTAAVQELAPELACRDYDPAIPGKDGAPAFADLVTCTDVIEHCEPEKLSAVLRHLRQLARNAVFLVAATRPSGKTLTDGRNAHLIIENADWWEAAVLEAGFTIHSHPISPSPKPSREWVAVLLP